MPELFYVSAAVAIVATAFALTRRNVVHGLLYLVVSLLAVALVFFAMGAAFVAALEAITYAGTIIVLFVFVVMMLGLRESQSEARTWSQPSAWAGPVLLCLALAAELFGVLWPRHALRPAAGVVSAERVGAALYGPYLVGVELASMLLLGALVGAHHLGRRRPPGEEARDGGRSDATSDAARPDAGRDPLRAGPGGPADPAEPAFRPHVP